MKEMTVDERKEMCALIEELAELAKPTCSLALELRIQRHGEIARRMATLVGIQVESVDVPK